MQLPIPVVKPGILFLACTSGIRVIELYDNELWNRSRQKYTDATCKHFKTGYVIDDRYKLIFVKFPEWENIM